MRVCCSWPSELKVCVSRQNDSQLVVSYNLLPRFVSSSLVSDDVSSHVCSGLIIGDIGLTDVSFALVVPRKVLAGVSGPINNFFFFFVCQF